MLLYEEMIELYTDMHPFLLVRLAEVHASLRSGAIAVGFFRKAQDILSQMGIVDEALDKFVQRYATEIDAQVHRAFIESQRSNIASFSYLGELTRPIGRILLSDLETDQGAPISHKSTAPPRGTSRGQRRVAGVDRGDL
ncbi:hypothetical protein OF83DRAFT_769376 [Amylostereum chailletii]|nr:hypothetical protein OF83DRAFT_769376 [Amylostereum chailletii]